MIPPSQIAPLPVSLDERVLVFAPTGRDAELACRFLQADGIAAEGCDSTDELTRKMEEGCAVIILAEEALGRETMDALIEQIARQPHWSEIPLCVITSGGQHSANALRRLIASSGVGNVTVLHRPFPAATLLNATHVCLGSRRRQYQVRALHEERERILAQLEQQVEERTRSLLETNEQLEAFCYTIAHDLRAPLRAQHGFATALLHEYGDCLDSTGRNYAERIIAAAGRLDGLVRDLLTYARLTRGEIVLAPLSLRKLVAEIREEMAFDLTDTILSLGNLDFEVLGHGASLKTVITNLLSNALKFTHPGRPPRIRLEAEEREGCVRFWVRDNGIGIAADHQEEIFTVFARLHKAECYPGTGVGLAIVRKVVERMGGRAGVDSVEGKGSDFWIELRRPD